MTELPANASSTVQALVKKLTCVSRRKDNVSIRCNFCRRSDSRVTLEESELFVFALLGLTTRKPNPNAPCETIRNLAQTSDAQSLIEHYKQLTKHL